MTPVDVQPAGVAESNTLNSVMTFEPKLAVEIDTVSVFEVPLEITVSTGSELSWYVNVYGAVPLDPSKVIVGSVAPSQTTIVVAPVMVAVGLGLTVIVNVSVVSQAIPAFE